MLNFGMRKFCYLSCTVILLLALQSCGLFDRSVTKTVTIESYQTQCTTSYPFFQTLCMVMIEPSGEETPVTGIGDFDYKWGYRYKLVIKETEPDPGLQDAPAVFRDLVEVVSKEEVAPGTRFETRLTTVLPVRDVDEGESRQLIVQQASDLFAFFRGVNWYGDDFGREFTCAPALCEEVSELIKQELELVLEFAHPESSTEPLVLKRVVSQEALPDGY